MKTPSRIAVISLACLFSLGLIASCGGEKDASEAADDATEEAADDATEEAADDAAEEAVEEVDDAAEDGE